MFPEARDFSHGVVHNAYAAQMHRSTNKTVDNKLHVLKEAAKDYLATCDDELA